MGRKNTNPVGRLFFTYNKETNESTCTVEGCVQRILKGHHSNNLETHIRSFHPVEYLNLQAVKNDGQIKRQHNINSSLFPSKVNIYQFN